MKYYLIDEMKFLFSHTEHIMLGLTTSTEIKTTVALEKRFAPLELFRKAAKQLAKHVREFQAVIPETVRKNYQSYMDCLLCLCFPIYETSCQKYYQGEGKQLREMLSPNELRRLEERLCFAIQILEDCQKLYNNDFQIWQRSAISGTFIAVNLSGR